MTELELSMTLGIMMEPEKNRVKVDPLLQAEILYLKHIFQIVQYQKQEVGCANPDVWVDLVPWHSLN